MQHVKRSVVDAIYDALETGTALNIDTERRLYEDCAVLRINDAHVTVSSFDAIKDVMREYDLTWQSINAVEQF